jgi:hypothetical protein
MRVPRFEVGYVAVGDICHRGSLAADGGGDGEDRERRPVDQSGQQLGLLIGHACDAQTSIELPHGLAQAVQIGPFSTYDTVRVLGPTLRTIGRGRSPTAQQVLHAVAVKGSDRPAEVEGWGLTGCQRRRQPAGAPNRPTTPSPPPASQGAAR